jgi:two-component system LytT family sensor kinase
VSCFENKPVMKKGNIWIHVAAWTGLYIFWLLLFQNHAFTLSRTMTIEFCYLLFITTDYYVIVYFIIPGYLQQKKYLSFILITAGLIALSAWLRALVAVQMNLHFFHTNPIPDFSKLYFNSIINIFLWVSLIIMIKMIIDRIQTQQQLEVLEKGRIKNELDYLKAQINPHALFNSLNTIYGHIDKSNQVARNILLQFSELLRFQLYDCGAEKVNLGKEFDYIKNYVAFQRLRKDEKLVINFEIENNETGLKIAPLLLVVLIENAFKFVSNFPDKENRIVIKIFTKDNILHSSFINTKELQQTTITKNPNGIGINNLKRRLELLYNQKYELTTNIGNDFYETNLIIDLA